MWSLVSELNASVSDLHRPHESVFRSAHLELHKCQNFESKDDNWECL